MKYLPYPLVICTPQVEKCNYLELTLDLDYFETNFKSIPNIPAQRGETIFYLFGDEKI